MTQLNPQHKLVIAYVEEFGSILPAKMGGEIYHGVMFGSETTKRCRDLVKYGILDRKKDGRFKRFFLKNVSDTSKAPRGDGARPVLQPLFAPQSRMPG